MNRELEELLESEVQAKEDEQIVRNVQSRLIMIIVNLLTILFKINYNYLSHYNSINLSNH